MNLTVNCLEDHIKLIEEEISNLHLPASPANLYEPIRYILKIGGKRMRPLLLLMGCKVYSEEIKHALGAAMAIELFHNFTLLHDDIMDNAPLRRNHETVHEKWNRDIAILSGDAMMVEAYKQLAKSPVHYLSTIIQIFNQCATEVCEGQQLDMDFEESLSITVPQYLEMIRKKTAVLPANALKVGAILGNASSNDAELLYSFGENLGLAFQLKDDLLDSFGDNPKFGKQKGGDIISNKKTYLLITALELAENATKKRLIELLNSKLNINPEGKVDEVIAIYKQLNIQTSTQNLIYQYHQKSMDILKSIKVPENRKQGLYEFANLLIDRDI